MASTDVLSDRDATSVDVRDLMADIGRRAKVAARSLAGTPSGPKDAALKAAASALRSGMAEIQSANVLDMDAGREKGLTAAMLDRLELTEARH